MNDPPVGRSIDEVVRLVKGYQFVDKNGEVCPAKWQPGGATIIPDPEKKRKYFEAEHK
jgi:peroxiredoxin (alkyl hydroperoxide reductase subunit C)